MSKQSTLSVRVILLISLTAIYGCSSTGINSATATAQSRRASAMATHVATGLQATLNAETIQATATAQSLQNALQSARQWPVIIFGYLRRQSAWLAERARLRPGPGLG